MSPQELPSISITRPDGEIKTMAEIEAEVIAAVLASTRCRSSTARKLGIGRSTLYRKIAEMNLPTEGTE